MNKLTSLNAFESISKNQMKELVGGKAEPVTATAGGCITTYLGVQAVTKRWTSDDSTGNLFGLTYDDKGCI